MLYTLADLAQDGSRVPSLVEYSSGLQGAMLIIKPREVEPNGEKHDGSLSTRPFKSVSVKLLSYEQESDVTPRFSRVSNHIWSHLLSDSFTKPNAIIVRQLHALESLGLTSG